MVVNNTISGHLTSASSEDEELASPHRAVEVEPPEPGLARALVHGQGAQGLPRLRLGCEKKTIIRNIRFMTQQIALFDSLSVRSSLSFSGWYPCQSSVSLKCSIRSTFINELDLGSGNSISYKDVPPPRHSRELPFLGLGLKLPTIGFCCVF